jgi:hypothetical protein
MLLFDFGKFQCWDRRSYGSGPTWQRHFVHNDSINVLLCENGKLVAIFMFQLSSSCLFISFVLDFLQYSGADDRRVNMLSSSDGAQIDSLQNINHAVTSMLLSDGELFVAGTGKVFFFTILSFQYLILGRFNSLIRCIKQGVRRYDIAGLNASLDAMAAAKVEAQKHAAEEAERLRLEAETAEAEKDKKKDKKDKGGKDDGKKKKKK